MADPLKREDETQVPAGTSRPMTPATSGIMGRITTMGSGSGSAEPAKVDARTVGTAVGGGLRSVGGALQKAEDYIRESQRAPLVGAVRGMTNFAEGVKDGLGIVKPKPAAPAAASTSAAPPANPATPASPVVARPEATAPAARTAAPVLQPGSANTFTGSDGRTRHVDVPAAAAAPASPAADTTTGAAAAPAPVTAPVTRPVAISAPAPTPAATSTAPSVIQLARPRVTARDFGAPDLAELQRRFEHTMGGKMTATERAGQLAKQRDIINQIAGSQIEAQRAGGAAAVEGQRADSASAVEAQRGQSAQAVEEAREAGANQRAQIAADVQRTTRPRQPVTLEDGSLVMVGEDGSLTPVTTPAGTPARPRNPDSAKRADKMLEGLAADTGDILAGLVQPGQQATQEQIASARLQAAQQRGLQIATNEQGDRVMLINGEWVPL